MNHITVTGIWNEKPLPRLKTYWPIQVAHLAPSRNTRILGTDSCRTAWLLSVSGPFCIWPKANCYHAQPERMASSLSNKLALPVRAHRKEHAIWLVVSLSAEERARIFIKHYEQETTREVKRNGRN